jgi:hypothetical protein
VLALESMLNLLEEFYITIEPSDKSIFIPALLAPIVLSKVIYS